MGERVSCGRWLDHHCHHIYQHLHDALSFVEVSPMAVTLCNLKAVPARSEWGTGVSGTQDQAPQEI